MSGLERSSRWQGLVAVLALVAGVASSCRKEPAPSIIAVSDTLGLAPSQTALIVEAATHYDTGPKRGPLAIRDTAFPGPSTPGDSAPHMSIATMTLKTGHARPPYRLIARIMSDGDYPAMGIYRGMNFVWRSSWDTTAAATWVTKVVPMTPSATEHVLKRDPRLHEYTSGDPAEPRLVQVSKASYAFAACLDDPMCGSGHCGYW